MSEIIIPSIITNIDGHDQAANTFSHELMKNRTIYITGEINDVMAAAVISQLRYLDSKSTDDITVLINSPGGSVSAGMAIFDAIHGGVHADVAVVATGQAASMGAFLLATGTKGKRYATPQVEIMLHQPHGGVQGQASDIRIAAEHIQRVKRNLAGILAGECGKSLEKLIKDMDRDNWLTAQEAKEYGLIDHIGYPNGKEDNKKYEY